MSEFIAEEPHDAGRLRDALHFAERDPLAYVALTSLLRPRVERAAPAPRFVLVSAADGTPAALATLESWIFLCGDDPAALRRLGYELATRECVPRIIEGAPDAIAGVVEGYGKRRPLPQIVHEMTRTIMVHDPASPGTPGSPEMEIRQATAGDTALIVAAHRDVVMSEYGYDPDLRQGYRARLEREVARGRWWLVEAGDVRLVFALGAHNAQTVRIENVWAPPDKRGTGSTGPAFAAVVERLSHAESPLSLEVGTANERAAALYRKAGFQFHALSHVMIFERRERASRT